MGVVKGVLLMNSLQKCVIFYLKSHRGNLEVKLFSRSLETFESLPNFRSLPLLLVNYWMIFQWEDFHAKKKICSKQKTFDITKLQPWSMFIKFVCETKWKIWNCLSINIVTIFFSSLKDPIQFRVIMEGWKVICFHM